jgi:hypothetical protein
MINQQPITPPLELLQQWWERADQYQDDPKTYFDFIVTEVAQWGADQELEACCEWLENQPQWMEDLRSARRPKPPSLKEQALAELAEWENVMDIAFDSPIRRALEALPE